MNSNCCKSFKLIFMDIEIGSDSGIECCKIVKEYDKFY
jgi:hypothetical protein